MRNGVATAFIVLSFVVVLMPLALLVGYVVARGHQVFGYAFLTKEIPTPHHAGAGHGSRGVRHAAHHRRRDRRWRCRSACSAAST